MQNTSTLVWIAEIFGGFLAVSLGILILLMGAAYLVDIRQSRHAIRRNFPVIGRFRYFFERLGEFFRQYFFAMDREEMPFNRAQRSWVYRAAKNVDGTLAFGSSRDINAPGTVLFVSHPFPSLADSSNPSTTRLIGPYCGQPYQPRSYFNISAMSFGALSRPAVSALSRGAAQAGCWLNTGEGALSRYHLASGCDLVFQIGTAKYGVRDSEGQLDDAKLREIAAHPQVRMFEIKLSQGAKPGKGGILPGIKVTEEIAEARSIPVGQDSISPNGHPDIRNVDQLLTQIVRIRDITGKPVGIKLVVGDGGFLEDLCIAIKDSGPETYAPDFITIDSGDGGSGAAPQSLLDNVGLCVRETLPMVVDLLKEHDLRERIKIIATGKLINPDMVAWALCAGADYVNSARGFMFALGCIQAMQCNKNTCPTGITTHHKKLQKGLDVEDKAQRVSNYVANMLKEVNTIAHACGVDEATQLSRQHARMITELGQSVPLDVLYRKQNEQNPLIIKRKFPTSF